MSEDRITITDPAYEAFYLRNKQARALLVLDVAKRVLAGADWTSLPSGTRGSLDTAEALVAEWERRYGSKP